MGSDSNMNPNFTSYRVKEYSNSFPNAQESNLFANFGRQVLSRKLNTDWPEQSLKTQELLNACYQSALDDKPVML
jgi:hypothetical protein